MAERFTAEGTGETEDRESKRAREDRVEKRTCRGPRRTPGAQRGERARAWQSNGTAMIMC